MTLAEQLKAATQAYEASRNWNSGDDDPRGDPALKARMEELYYQSLGQLPSASLAQPRTMSQLAPPPPSTARDPQQIPRFVLVTGDRVDTGRADGTDPRQFPNMDAFLAWQRASGETSAIPVQSAEAAIQIVRDFTGNPGYQGFESGPPAPQPGSPAARGVDPNEWWDSYSGNPHATPPPGSPPPNPPPPGPTPPPGPNPAPNPTPNPTPHTPTPGKMFIRMPDGSKQEFWAMDTAWDQALRAGGMPIDPLTGEDLPASEPFGPGQGWVFGPDSLPGNVIFGQGWLPGQLEKWNDQKFAGTLASSYGKTFSHPEFGKEFKYPEYDKKFDYPEFDKKFEWDPSKIKDDPAYQFMLEEGTKAQQRQASARMGVGDGRTMKELERYRTGLASTFADTYYDRATRDFEREYGLFNDRRNQAREEFDVDYGLYTDKRNQAVQDFGRDYGLYTDKRGQAVQDWERDYNIFEQTQAKRFNRLASVAGQGQTAAGSLSSSPINQAPSFIAGTGGTMSQLALNAGDIRGSGYAAGAANRQNSLRPFSTLADLYALGRYS